MQSLAMGHPAVDSRDGSSRCRRREIVDVIMRHYVRRGAESFPSSVSGYPTKQCRATSNRWPSHPRTTLMAILARPACCESLP